MTDNIFIGVSIVKDLKTLAYFYSLSSNGNFIQESITFTSSWLSILVIVLVAAYRTSDVVNHLDVSLINFLSGVNFARVPPLWATLLRF